MLKHVTAGLATVVSVGAAVLVLGAGPAAADSGTLYVNNTTGSNCADLGPGAGTQTQPYCTIGAAVAVVSAGQTIDVTGTYLEHVTITRSGVAAQPGQPAQPVTVKARVPGAASLSGQNAGFTVDGAHDVTISGINVTNYLNNAGILLRDSARISVFGLNVSLGVGATAPGAQLEGVTDSTLDRVTMFARSGTTLTTAFALDAATSGVTVNRANVNANFSPGGKGIDVTGTGNKVLNSTVRSVDTVGILVEPGAVNTVIANNSVGGIRGTGIQEAGGTGTAITNNDAVRACRWGIKISGTSSGASVQNNLARLSEANSSAPCDPSVTTPGVDIGVYDSAVTSTVVDYNNTYQSVASDYLYAWNTPMNLADFRTASGQGAHDLNSTDQFMTYDCANSAAPGYQSTDYRGYSREDNPNAANSGAGPLTFADRGPSEFVTPATPRLALTSATTIGSITADASASTPGWAPIASYTFDFGDGSAPVTQTAPVATHPYTRAGSYTVWVTITDTAGASSAIDQSAACVPAPPAADPASRIRSDFNGDGRDDVALLYNRGAGNTELWT